MSTKRFIEKLVEGVEGWILSRADEYAGRFRTVSKEDFAQEGRLAAWRCARRYDPDRGVSFLTYARPCIDGRMETYAGNTSRLVRVPLHRANTEQHEYFSLDAAARQLEEYEGILVDPGCPFEAAADHEMRVLLKTEIRRLEPREQEILRRRFINEETLSAIAADVGVTRERVRQIESEVLKTLRRRLEKLCRAG